MGHSDGSSPKNASLYILILLIVIAIIIIVVIWFWGGTKKNNLPAPTGLTATVNESTVTLNWNLVSGADKYRVYITKNSNCDWGNAEFKQDVNGPPAEVSNLENATYYFSVAPIKFCNGFETVGAASAAVSATVPQCNGTPDAPADIIVNPGHQVGYAKVTWSAVPNAAGYVIYRSENAPVSTSSYTQRYPIDNCQTDVVFVGLACGSTQNFIVTATNACGTEGAPSPVGTIVVPSQEFWGEAANNVQGASIGKNETKNQQNSGVIDSFVDITDVVPQGNSIALSWSPFKNADEYNVYIKEGGTVDSGEGEHDSVQTLSNTITSYTFRNLVPGKTYSVGVSIIKKGQEGGVAYFPVQLTPENSEQQHIHDIESQ